MFFALCSDGSSFPFLRSSALHRSLLDATYFVFISITTIGLGDYIPGDSMRHMETRDIYKTVVGLFLLVGLVLTSLTLTVFYDIPQLNLGLHPHRHK